MTSFMRLARTGSLAALLCAFDPLAAGAATIDATGTTPKTYSGIVGSDGSVVIGKGFTVAHNGTGSYTIAYPSSDFKAAFPVMTVSGFGAANLTPIAVVDNESCSGTTCTFGVVIFSNTGTQSDNGFTFNIIQAVK